MHNNTPPSRDVFGLTLLFLVLFAYNNFAQSLSGYYTLGGEQSDFPTFRSAIHKLDSFGVSGPVVFKVKDGVYYESDTIRSVKGTSATNTILFQSESKDSSSVVLEWNSQKSGNWNLWLNRAGFITFKNIGFRQLFDGGKQNVHLIDCHNITFENCLFEGSNMVMDGALLTGTIDSNLTVKNCTFQYARRGVDLRGGAKSPAKNLHFTGNSIHTQNTGIALGNTSKAIVRKNQFLNITGGAYAGILIKGAKSITVSGNELKVSANKDHSRAIDLINLDGDSISPSLIFNNVVNMSAHAGKDVFALKTGSLSNTIISNNTLVLNADNNQLAVVGFCPNEDGVTQSSFVNNIVANMGTGAAYSGNTNVGPGLKNDYNLWYSLSGNITTEESSLSAIIAKDSSNQHSYFTDPLFYHSDTLISNTTFIDSNAISVSGITEDILGNKRNSDFPDVGAFERLHLPYLNLPIDTAACQTLTLQAKSNASWYNWSNGGHSDSITVTSSGYIWVTAINGDGHASDSTYVTINQPNPFIVSAALDSLLPGQCVQLSTNILSQSNSSVVWSDATGLIVNQNAITVCPQNFPAIYNVEVLDSNGCSSQQSFTIYQGTGSNLFVYHSNEPAASAVQIQNNGTPVTKSSMAGSGTAANSAAQNLIVFPNPAVDVVTLQFTSALKTEPTIHISDVAGNLTPISVMHSSPTNLRVDLSGLANGSYIFVVTTAEEVFRKSVVKIGH